MFRNSFSELKDLQKLFDTYKMDVRKQQHLSFDSENDIQALLLEHVLDRVLNKGILGQTCVNIETSSTWFQHNISTLY